MKLLDTEENLLMKNQFLLRHYLNKLGDKSSFCTERDLLLLVNLHDNDLIDRTTFSRKLRSFLSYDHSVLRDNRITNYGACLLIEGHDETSVSMSNGRHDAQIDYQNTCLRLDRVGLICTSLTPRYQLKKDCLFLLEVYRISVDLESLYFIQEKTND